MVSITRPIKKYNNNLCCKKKKTLQNKKEKLITKEITRLQRKLQT